MTAPEKLHLEQMKRLSVAIELLNQADTIIQQTLRATPQCYSIYTRINDIMEELEDLCA